MSENPDDLVKEALELAKGIDHDGRESVEARNLAAAFLRLDTLLHDEERQIPSRWPNRT
jgi:hypothetical protein